MAQVKLQFKSINDRQHVATRSMQLTVKKTTRSQKTLDCSLVVVNNGERTTTSTRQAQLDEMIPERLGVSPAILDAVIFCHQDESLWPLSEPAALKKRFDEIFEALKYTKAIENLKVLRKKQVEQLGKLQNDEAHNKINKDRGDRAEKRMTGLQAEIEGARDKSDAISAEMEETKEKIREKREQSNSFLQIVQNLSNKREQLDYRQDAVNELKQSIEVLEEDDATLERSLSQYEESMERQQDEAKQGHGQHRELQGVLAESRKSLSTKLSEQGKHESDKEKHERQIKARTEMIHEAARQYDFRGFDEELSEQLVKSFNEKIQKLLNDKKRDLERLQKDNAAELDKATAAITDLEGRKAARTQDRVSAKQRMGAIEKRTSILQNESSLIEVDQGAKAILDEQLVDLNARFSKAQNDFEKSNWDAQLSEETDKLFQIETENTKLGRELVECTRLASERAQLDYRKKEVADKKRKLETLTTTWKPKLSAILGGEYEPSDLESAFQSTLNSQQKSVTDARQRRDQVRQKQQKVEYKLKGANTDRDKKSEELELRKGEVLKSLRVIREDATIEDYSEELRANEQQAEELRNELSLFDALADYYNKCKRMLATQKKCLLCDRHFDDSQRTSLERLEKKIEKQMDPKAKVDVDNDLQEITQSLESLRAVRSAYDTYERLTKELPKVQNEVKDAQSEFDALERQLEDLSAAVSTEEEKLRDIEDLSKTVSNIAQTVKDIAESESQVDRIASQQASGSANRTVDEIHELQAQLEEQMRAHKNKITKLTGDKQRAKDQMAAIELEKSELRNKVSVAAGQLDKKEDLLQQIQSLKNEQVNQREMIQRADEELEKIEPGMAEARSIRDEVLRRGRSKEQAIIDSRDAVSSAVNEIKMVDADIQDYLDRGGPANLASNQRAIGTLEKSIASTEEEIAQLTRRTNKLQQDIESGDRKKKNISDNLNYRKHLRTLEVLRQEIDDLEDRNAHEDYERLQSEARTLENHSNRLFAERGSVMGTMKTKDEELGRLLKEWEIDYKDAKQKYRESHIRVETTKAAIEDLAQCGSAVDKAVMQFHAMKMAEVNRIAGELWQSTYQGTDIDTILIRSDNEGTSAKRNYNYRLCMVKQDTEMDMRGRCSAGQKVLASIIIRLALAESFGVNCGLIALDEPTTNLDRDNIKSLAESLHMIIRTRQAQSNFQLIVITHDEDFLRHMRCSDFCDSFYRVKRDERQNSVISRESITKIF